MRQIYKLPIYIHIHLLIYDKKFVKKKNNDYNGQQKSLIIHLRPKKPKIIQLKKNKNILDICIYFDIFYIIRKMD